MPKFELTVIRHEIYTTEVVVEADSYNAAVAETQTKLSDKGWDAVVLHDEGKRYECWSEVVEHRVDEPDGRLADPGHDRQASSQGWLQRLVLDKVVF